MPKVFHYPGQDGSAGAYSIFCPACRNEHPFDAQRWQFNGDFERPTFSPSMLIRVWDGWVKIPDDRWLTYDLVDRVESRVPIDWVGEDCAGTVDAVAGRLGVEPTADVVSREIRQRIESMSPSVCHSFVRDGRIEFLADCTHAMAGQTVDLGTID